MYKQFWGFNKSPFSGTIDPDRFYESPGHEEALARLSYVVDESRQGALVLGAAGTGKTLLAEVFARRMRRPNRQVVIARGSALGGRDLFFELAQECGLAPDRAATEAELWRTLRNHVVANRTDNCQTVLVIDQAHWLADDASNLRSLHLLFQLDTHPASLLTIVLVARPEILRTARAEIVELVDLGVVLDPLTAEQTGLYIEQLTKWAGRNEPAFTADAIERIYELTGGVPRQINRVCDLALVAGATEELDRVTEEVVSSVYQELSPDAAIEELSVAV
jgi:general secretion pathway protein A